METWLKPIEEHTFRTTSFTLTQEELDVVVQCNLAHFRRTSFSKEQETVLGSVGYFLSPVTLQIEQRIDEELQKFGGEAFVKLNTRFV
jgi:hypothetical protein